MNPLFSKAAHFFEDIQSLNSPDLKFVVIAHLLDEEQVFIRYLQQMEKLILLLPKPRSANPEAVEHFSQEVRTEIADRCRLTDPEYLADLINSVCQEKRVVLLDIGGYFAPALNQLPDYLDNELVGVVEMTENGHQRYQSLSELRVPVISTARSPLKAPEDYLTGQSIVYSAEALMRECHLIMNGGNAAVFGYGKIGRAIAESLHMKNINTKVVEIDPVRAIEAKAMGFDLIDKDEALRQSDMIFCATGNQSLCHRDFNRIKNGAFIFSVTSSDDELDLSKTASMFEISPVTQYISRYEQLGQYFYLANEGNAINFIHNAELGPYVFLVEAEMLAGAFYLEGQQETEEILELPAEQQRSLANIWLSHFR